MAAPQLHSRWAVLSRLAPSRSATETPRAATNWTTTQIVSSQCVRLLSSGGRLRPPAGSRHRVRAGAVAA